MKFNIDLLIKPDPRYKTNYPILEVSYFEYNLCYTALLSGTYFSLLPT